MAKGHFAVRSYLEVESQVAPFPPQSAQLALERAPQVLDLVPVVDRQEVTGHLRILHTEEMLQVHSLKKGSANVRVLCCVIQPLRRIHATPVKPQSNPVHTWAFDRLFLLLHRNCADVDAEEEEEAALLSCCC